MYDLAMKNTTSSKFGVRKTGIVTLLLIAMGISACSFSVSVGGGDDLNTNNLEREIATELEQQTGVKAEDVSCPDDIKIEKDHTFQCTATADDGSRAEIEVEQLDDESNVHWQVIDSSEHVGGSDQT